MADGDESLTLDYSSPLYTGDRKEIWTAFLLCAAGLLCWLAVLCRILLFFFGRYQHIPLEQNPILPITGWLIAIVTGSFSIFYYWRRPKRWFVVVCLAINVSGLLFTAFVLCASLVAW
jgi:hypothetical protein